MRRLAILSVRAQKSFPLEGSVKSSRRITHDGTGERGQANLGETDDRLESEISGSMCSSKSSVRWILVAAAGRSQSASGGRPSSALTARRAKLKLDSNSAARGSRSKKRIRGSAQCTRLTIGFRSPDTRRSPSTSFDFEDCRGSRRREQIDRTVLCQTGSGDQFRKKGSRRDLEMLRGGLGFPRP